MNQKMVTVQVPEIALKSIYAISELANEKKDINPHSISKRIDCKWDTAKKYFTNKFNIKEI